MGFFSWKCAKCKKSVSNKYSAKPELSACYLVTPYTTFYETSYEGYGVFGGVDVYSLLGDGDRDKGVELEFNNSANMPFQIKLVHKQCFNDDKYEELCKSNNDPDQGYFYDWVEE